MRSPEKNSYPHIRAFRIVRPVAERGENENLWTEVRKYSKLIPSEPNPNMGRVQEIREEIKKGTYMTPEVLEETAARLAIRFTMPEHGFPES